MAQGKAYFISLEGHVRRVRSSHIVAMVEDPDAFGTTWAKIQAVYAERGEAVGVEGEARAIILKELLAKGWVRIREHVNRQWSVEFDRATPKVKSFARRWARGVLKKGIATDRYMPVALVGISDNYRCTMEMGTLATASAFKVEGPEEWRLRWAADQP